MNDHLPECYQSEGKWGGGCICVSLRACEQRVLGNRDEIIGVTAWRSFRNGLDAAREAVDSMVIETAGNSAATVNQALAAIDALRENND